MVLLMREEAIILTLMMKMNQYLEEILTKIEPINMSIYDLVSKPNINFEELDSLGR